MKRLRGILRRRGDVGADCMDCDWQEFGSSRRLAIDHAREAGHRTHFVVEETTVYDGKSDP